MVLVFLNRYQAEPTAWYLLHAGFLLGLFIDPEYGGDMLLRNVGWLSTDYAVLYPKRYNSSGILPFYVYVYKVWNSMKCMSRESAVGIATGYGLDGGGVGVRVPLGARFSPLHVAQTDCGAHPASYPIHTGGSFPGGKAAGALSWPLASN
jgi:hypothetical protein